MAKLDRFSASVERLTDLVRYQRHELFNQLLIDEQEFAALVADSDSGQRVARLEGYDRMRERIAALEAENAELKRMQQRTWGNFGDAMRTVAEAGAGELVELREQNAALVAIEAEAMAILQKATGRTDYHNIVEAVKAVYLKGLECTAESWSSTVLPLHEEIAELRADRERLDFVLAQEANILSRDGLPLDDRDDIDAARKAGA